ncbi:hypothetical protein AB0C84_37715 [Actinomadura sp. NPDC048955]
MTSTRRTTAAARRPPRNREMSDLAFILLTVAVFAVFALVVKAVERL